MAVFVVLLGPPGAGKGTQALRLAQSLNVPHISSGALFREHLKNQTELGVKANAYIEQGQLVPDDVTIGMIRERLSRPDCAPGAILDGFPRTPPQAEALDAILKDLGSSLRAVIHIKVAEEVLARRVCGRRTCREAGHIFHVEFNPPKVPGVCDYDGSELYQRRDDMRETVLERVEVYQRQTTPLIEHFRKRNLLREVNGVYSIDDVTAAMIDVLKSPGETE
jgi:adenylate kinase